MSILKLENVVMQFGGVFAINDFSMEIDKGEIVALIGPNGAGKTTVFNVITGVYQPTSGKVVFNNRDITNKRPDLITKSGMARTFQNIRLFKDLTVLENVLISQHLHVRSGLFESALTLPRARKEEKAMREKAERLLDELGILQYKDHIASSLPYGLQRRLEITRALATDPTILLLDEPAAGMNPQETMELTEFILKIKEKYNLSVFMIEHHMDLVMKISDRIYVLDFGKLIASGKPEEIQNNQRVIDAYLGVADDVEG